MTHATTSVRDAALAWHDAGVCVLPAAGDGSKRPGVGSWTRYQHEQYPRQALADMQSSGIGLVCGAVSGGLEMLELEGRAVAEGGLAIIAAVAEAQDVSALWRRVTTDDGAYQEHTPSGGLHILYRIADAPVPGNTKLASRPANNTELAAKPKERIKGLAETRGEGGYVVVAPSGGPTHPTGLPWTVAFGRPGTVPTITAVERKQLHELFRALDQMPERPAPAQPVSTPQPRPAGSGLSPADDFAARTGWAEILEPEGWRENYVADGVTYWIRPGKDRDTSATTNHGGNDRLKVFTTSTEFETIPETYSKFGAYTLLNYGSISSHTCGLAARDLGSRGFGTPPLDTVWPLATPAPTWAGIIAPPEPAAGGQHESPHNQAATKQGGMIPAPYEVMAVARQWLTGEQVDGVLTIRRWRGGWMIWERARWIERNRDSVTASLWLWLENARYLDVADDPPKVKPWRPSNRKVSEVIAAVEAITLLSEDTNPPAWIVADGQESSDATYVSVRNGLLNVATRQLNPHDPRFFNLVSVPFAYDPEAPAPARWLKFLAELWPDDPDSIAALQEFFGYVLSGRTDLHKILLIVGPPRGGKGTIARILTALIGKGSIAGPTLASFNTNFGMAPLLDKPLAIVSDARLAGRDSQQVVERLLTLSGEDAITVDRKNRDAWTGQLPTRLVILSNELPTFGDSSGAIATRFITLVLANSWLGNEDINLGHDLAREMPGILNWALDGLDRVRRTDRITEPGSSVEAMLAIKDAASPVSAFLREMCETGADCRIAVDELWAAWKTWCDDNGRHAGSKQKLSRDIRAVVPSVQVARPRDADGRQRVFAGLALADCGRPASGPHGPHAGPHDASTQFGGKPLLRTGAGPHGPHGPHENRNSSVQHLPQYPQHPPIGGSENTRISADHADHNTAASANGVSAMRTSSGPHADQAADHPDQARCCGRKALAGAPLVNACQLCAESRTFWRRPTPSPDQGALQ